MSKEVGLRLLHAPACASAVGQLPGDLLKALVSLRHFGVSVGGLERAHSGSVHQHRTYKTAPRNRHTTHHGGDWNVQGGFTPTPYAGLPNPAFTLSLCRECRIVTALTQSQASWLAANCRSLFICCSFAMD